MKYFLGLDIGATSIGWAVVHVDSNGNPKRIIDSGVRIFEAGVEGDLDSGKESSKATKRREARLARRQTHRRDVRRRATWRVLEKHGLLPKLPSSDGIQRDEAIKELDAKLKEKFVEAGNHQQVQVLPYLIRAAAVEQKLELEELGRAFYHLAQRRGYQSNRKADQIKKDDEDLGKVASGIATLQEKKGDRTLGQYFATVHPDDRKQEEERIRQQWTAREMFKEEFEKICDTQREHYPDLFTEEFVKELRVALFFQRPLKSQKGLVGRCAIYPEYRRCQLALPEAQEFRVLQQLNHLTYTLPQSTPQRLSGEQWQKLYHRLMTMGDCNFKDAKKLIGIKQNVPFNLQEGGEKRLVGNRTGSKMRNVFGDEWDKYPADRQDIIIRDVLNYQKHDKLVERAQEAFGLSQEKAEKLAGTSLEDGYSRHSRVALRELNEVMSREEHPAYSEARLIIDPEAFSSGDGLKSLPPLKKFSQDFGKEITNPAVTRALTEVRKVVNAIIEEHDKPWKIRIETAREIKQGKRSREVTADKMRKRQKEREAAKKRIFDDLGFEAKRGDIEKLLLYDECDGKCPYSGDVIGSMQRLFSGEFEVEHILPRKYLDDSFKNKTLCRSDLNKRKGNQIPFQAFGQDKQEWTDILGRVGAFKGEKEVVAEKLRRFRMQEPPDVDDFVERQLNDTRYNTTLACEYLALLFGGLWDEDNRIRRIEAVAGQITAKVRDALKVGKTRDVHTHHALDAVIVAITSPSYINKFSVENQYSRESGRVIRDLPYPCTNFKSELYAAIDNILVSHRPTRRISGPLHKETLYSPRKEDGKVRIRKPLAALSKADLQKGHIADPVLRAIITQKWEEAGKPDPAKFFSDEKNLPTMPSEQGNGPIIRKVRLALGDNPHPIGDKKHRQRHAILGSNHHVEFVAIHDADGEIKKYDMRVVSMLEAKNRVRDGRPVIGDGLAENESAVMSFCKNDMLWLDDVDGARRLFRVASFSEGDFNVRPHDEARLKKDIPKQKIIKDWRMRTAKAVMERTPEPAKVGTLGK
ncbi:type II CRISPR RNA-guided endonuclease Cas9 [Calycomorphotria hydatis]|uniref:CRISPR-associated endonuclease Cas9 n=1 Tax=Calycomorphotria hydatis TaxID=2528027 RepID=A0A517TA75_9PLAN|nr:type II CRISPR RNA-guided endonuclease Cas9 [Calycomorphotria hydatis]QDT65275.1 CRISPR-associated endonuclease Cas9/Csn1 [Calycomorphotria hydatis]